jgi:hypothetical protein
VSGRTAQVQNQSGQVAVTWTAKTAFTEEVATQASALKAGDCVVAMPAQTAGSSKTDADAPVAAATVRITAPVDESCTGGMRARTGGGTPPPGAPSGAPSGGPGAGGGRNGSFGGLGVFGKVTAVSGSGFTVESALPGSGSTPTSTEVTTTADTTWTTTKKTTAKAVKVGRCVSSMGRPDSTGAITAVSMTVSSPVGGECTLGFGRGAARRPGSNDVQGSNEAQHS